jgi:hypothetical protein
MAKLLQFLHADDAPRRSRNMKDNLAVSQPDPQLAAQQARAVARPKRPAIAVMHEVLKPEPEERPIPYFLRLRR